MIISLCAVKAISKFIDIFGSKLGRFEQTPTSCIERFQVRFVVIKSYNFLFSAAHSDLLRQ